MLLVAVVMPGAGGGFDVITQTAAVPMPMLYLNGGNRPGAVSRQIGMHSFNVPAQGREVGLPAQRLSGAAGWDNAPTEKSRRWQNGG
jgi:hypothetical protein